MQRNIILIGFMGTGKSTIGRNLSRASGCTLIDTDNLLEEQEGCAISQIFAQKGEDSFRSRPLLNHKAPEKTIRELLEQRTPLYRETAHLEIETDHLSFEEVTAGIIESARYHFGSQAEQE